MATRRYSFSTSRRSSLHGLSALARVAPLPATPRLLPALKVADLLPVPPVRVLPGSDAMDSDFEAVAIAASDCLLADPIDFDSAEDDGSMSDVDDDQEAFYAVFPQAPTLAKQHALRPLVDALRKLLARPGHLFAALLPDAQLGAVQDLAALEAKAVEYRQKQLGHLISQDHWQRIADFQQRRAGREDRWTSPQLAKQVDEMMIKLTMHYAHLWTYVCAITVGIVNYVERTVSLLHSEWTTALVCTVSAATHPQAIKPVAMETTAMCRPLRLRSQTAATLSIAAGKKRPAPPSSPEVSDSNESHRRARLARESNEFMIAWFLHHKSNPYPSATERVQIAKRTGLTEQQVRNWFANMRKRHWKPKADKKAKKPRCLLDLLLRQNDATKA